MYLADEEKIGLILPVFFHRSYGFGFQRVAENESRQIIEFKLLYIKVSGRWFTSIRLGGEVTRPVVLVNTEYLAHLLCKLRSANYDNPNRTLISLCLT